MDIKNFEKRNLIDYGFNPTMMPDDVRGTPARITAVHKERYELIFEAFDAITLIYCDYAAF